MLFYGSGRLCRAVLVTRFSHHSDCLVRSRWLNGRNWIRPGHTLEHARRRWRDWEREILTWLWVRQRRRVAGGIDAQCYSVTSPPAWFSFATDAGWWCRSLWTLGRSCDWKMMGGVTFLCILTKKKERKKYNLDTWGTKISFHICLNRVLPYWIKFSIIRDDYKGQKVFDTALLSRTYSNRMKPQLLVLIWIKRVAEK